MSGFGCVRPRLDTLDSVIGPVLVPRRPQNSGIQSRTFGQVPGALIPELPTIRTAMTFAYAYNSEQNREYQVLEKLAKHEDEYVRRRATEALKKIAGTAVPDQAIKPSAKPAE